MFFHTIHVWKPIDEWLKLSSDDEILVQFCTMLAVCPGLLMQRHGCLVFQRDMNWDVTRESNCVNNHTIN